MSALPDGQIGDLAGFRVYEQPWMKPGQVLVFDGTILAELNDYVLVSLWISDMARDLRRDLVRLVAEAEVRLFGPKDGAR